MNKKRIGLKIGAFILAVILIGLIGSLANAFLGNPVSASLASKAAKDYLEENYSHLDLALERPVYNFKFNEYMVKAWSKTSIDTWFNIYYRKGEIIRDDYESHVLGKFNTLYRLENELNLQITPIVASVPELQEGGAHALVEKWEYEQQDEAIQLDMTYDQSLPIDYSLIINAPLKDEPMESATAILENTHKALVTKGYHFTTYNLYLNNDEVLLNVIHASPEDIESSELIQRLESALNQPEEEIDKKELDEKAPLKDNDIIYEERLGVTMIKKNKKQ